MANFLHTYTPQLIIFSLGPLTLHWYGFFIVLGIISAISVALALAKYYSFSKELIIDLAFWLVVAGIIGARAYEVFFVSYNYYISHPGNILKIWQGGLAIHGAIIGGIIALIFFSKNKKINFWNLAAIIVPGVALGQAIGRWGNYFNQELFGLPTNLPWGIPIQPMNRPGNYIDYNYFHPTFFYESLGCLLIFLILIAIHFYFIKRKKFFPQAPVLVYLFLYSLLRFFLEFIKIDETPIYFGWRLPQIVSALIIFLVIVYSVKLIIRPNIKNKSLNI